MKKKRIATSYQMCFQSYDDVVMTLFRHQLLTYCHISFVASAGGTTDFMKSCTSNFARFMWRNYIVLTETWWLEIHSTTRWSHCKKLLAVNCGIGATLNELIGQAAFAQGTWWR